MPEIREMERVLKGDKIESFAIKNRYSTNPMLLLYNHVTFDVTGSIFSHSILRFHWMNSAKPSSDLREDLEK